MTPTLNRCFGIILLAAVLSPALANAGNAQEKGAQAPQVEEKQFDWDTDQGFQLRAAAAVVGAGNAQNALATRLAISENVPTVPGWDFNEAFPLDKKNLELIRDGRRLPDRRNKPLITDLAKPDQGFYRALLEALRRSRWASEEMMENSAKRNPHVVLADLLAAPKNFRGKVISVKGKITLVRRDDPLREMTFDDLIPNIYSTYIIGPTPKAPPFAAIFAELPRDVPVSETLDLEVTFQGYFLGMVLFPANKDPTLKKDLLCPYLVGKTLIVHGNKKAVPPPAETPFSAQLILWSFGIIVGIVFLGAGLMLWFRRGDRHVHSQLQLVRDKHQPFNLEPDAAPADDSANSVSPPER